MKEVQAFLKKKLNAYSASYKEKNGDAIKIPEIEEVETLIKNLKTIINYDNNKSSIAAYRIYEIALMVDAMAKIFLPPLLYIKNLQEIINNIKLGSVKIYSGGLFGSNELQNTMQEAINSVKNLITVETVKEAITTVKESWSNLFTPLFKADIENSEEEILLKGFERNSQLLNLSEVEQTFPEIYIQIINCANEQYEFEKYAEHKFYQFCETPLTDENETLNNIFEKYQKIYYAQQILIALNITKDLSKDHQQKIIEELQFKSDLYTQAKNSNANAIIHSWKDVIKFKAIGGIGNIEDQCEAYKNFGIASNAEITTLKAKIEQLQIELYQTKEQRKLNSKYDSNNIQEPPKNNMKFFNFNFVESFIWGNIKTNKPTTNLMESSTGSKRLEK